MSEPTEVRAPEGARVMEIDWDDGLRARYRHRTLRGFCPCASCQGHQGPVRWWEGTDALPEAGFELVSIEQVGNYAIQLGWGDGHRTGIYSYRYLRELAPLFEMSEEALRKQTFGR